MYDHQFVYLDYGCSDVIAGQLHYSLETLLAEIGNAVDRVSIFTDRPSFFEGIGFDVVDIRPELLSFTQGGRYNHRAKQIVLAQALKRIGRACVLLDSDSFVRPGFDREVARCLETGAAMNFFVRRDPYPGFGPFSCQLPHVGLYRYDPFQSIMFNSGLVAVRPQHVDLIEDAVLLIDFLLDGGLHRHDIDQFAITECLRTSGVEIGTINRHFEHYCPRWSKRYMIHKLSKRKVTFENFAPKRPSIIFNKTRVRLFKGVSLTRQHVSAVGDAFASGLASILPPRNG